MKVENNMYDTIIIGSGPSGLTAALNLRRNDKKVLILEKETIGGQIATSPRVENIPGTVSISGIDFIDKLFDQVTNLGAEFELDEAKKIEKVNNYFKVICNYKTYETKSIVIASGVTHRLMGIPNEEKLVGKGISYCAVCDGAFYKDKDVCLIGDANTALQYAIALSSTCNKIYLNTLFDKFFGDKILIDRVLSKPNIIIEHNLSLTEIIGDNYLEKLVFKNTKTNETKEFKVDGCFIAIGQEPHNEIFKDYVDLERGFIIVDENMKTKTDGIYAVGDCRKKKIRQLVTAFNDASIASFNVVQYLDSL